MSDSASEDPLRPDPLPPPPVLHRATHALVGIGCGLAIADALSGGLLSAPARLFPAFLWDGALWLLVTPSFLHGGPIHLVANLLVLMLVGPAVERIYGRGRTLAAYVMAGMAAVVASAALLPAEAAVAASGATLGLVGLLFGTMLLQPEVIPEAVHDRLRWWLAAAVGVEVLAVFASVYVNHALHIGGLGAGFLLGAVLEPEAGRRTGRPLAVTMGLLLAVGIGLGLVRSRAGVEHTLTWAFLRAEDHHGVDLDRAIAVLEPALERPDAGSADRDVRPLAQNALAWFYAEAGRNLERGIALSEESNAKRQVPMFLDTLGYLYALAGRCADARDAMGRAAELDPAFVARRDEVARACASGERPDLEVPVVTPTPTPTPESTPARRPGIRV